MNKRQLLILCLLEQLNTVHPYGMRPSELHQGVINQAAFRADTLDSIASLLADMESMGFVSSKPDSLDRAVSLYTRTDEGRVQLAKHGRATSNP